MSRLNDLIRQVANKDGQLAADLKREFDELVDRRAFGLNFERHTPEAVELPGRPVRKNDKVRILPERGTMPKKADERLFKVLKTHTDDGVRWADLEAMADPEGGRSVVVDDLVVVAEFRDPIYPGLVSTGKVGRGGDKPFHTVINAENYHALQALLFTHRGKVDAIYIDPPYNTGAKDWKYNNDYVESDDHYRHSKWLAFMERRLRLAKELLNPDDSVLVVTIDEKECSRLGLLLEQTFPEGNLQMVSAVINGQGSSRIRAMSRVDEYLFFVYFGAAAPFATAVETLPSDDNQSQAGSERIWFPLIRGGKSGVRSKSYDSFFPINIRIADGTIHSVGEPLPRDLSVADAPEAPTGCVSIWPVSKEGVEGRWQMGRPEFLSRLAEGYIRVGKRDGAGRFPVTYIRSGTIDRIATGEVEVVGRDANGALELRNSAASPRGRIAKTVWYLKAHNSGTYGTALLERFIPNRAFPFPKSLYAVEDTLRFVVSGKPEALVVDFFSGSGTTAHAVMRLNKQDGGNRRCIAITNNEVSADEQHRLREEGLRPGDPGWEKWGICDFVTKPRLDAAVTGKTPEGNPVKGDYKFVDEFPMSEGLEENIEFFTLTYESAIRLASHREFARVAPFLWLMAGSSGRRIEDISTGWDVAETYGVIANLDLTEPFVQAAEAQDRLTHAFIVTDEDRLFEATVRQLPAHVEPVRLYSSYLRTFEIEAGRTAR